MVDVTGNAVNFSRVDHDRARAGLDGGRKGWQKIFAQIVFRNPGRRSVSAAQRRTVANVMFQTGSDMILGGHVVTFQPTHERDSHHFSKIGIFTERFVEPWPERLAPDLEDW